MIEMIKSKVAELKREILALYLAARDPRTPWYAKAFVLCVVAYAVSPIDLIPDVIPVLGYIDDLLLLPLGIYIAIKLIPQAIMTDCRARATFTRESLPRNWSAATAIIVVWLAAAILLAYYLTGWVLPKEPLEARFGY